MVEYLVGTDAVFCQLVLVQIDTDLLVLQSVGAEVGDGIDAAQAVLQPVDVGVQFPIGFLLAFHRDEQGRGIGNVVHCLQGENA